MKKLIINADDFGYSRAVNYGIIDSHKNGIVTSTTLMPAMPGYGHAVELAKEHPELAIGVHLTLTCGKPISENVESLVDNKGNFKKLNYYDSGKYSIDSDELYYEWDKQIKRVIDTKINITHLDSHHHIHTYDKMLEVAYELSKKYDLPIRNCFEIDEKVDILGNKKITGFWNMFDYPEMRTIEEDYETVKQNIYEAMKKNILEFTDDEITEGMCHPAYVDINILQGSSFNLLRLREVEMLKDNRIREIIEGDFGIKLCNYKNI